MPQHPTLEEWRLLTLRPLTGFRRFGVTRSGLRDSFARTVDVDKPDPVPERSAW